MLKQLARALNDLAMQGRLSDESSNNVGYVLSDEFQEPTGNQEFDESVQKKVNEFVDDQIRDVASSIRTQIEDAGKEALKSIGEHFNDAQRTIDEQTKESLDIVKERNESIGQLIVDLQERVTRLESLFDRVQAVEKKQQQRQTTAKKS